MRKMTIYCDRCGKQIDTVSKLLTTFIYNVNNTEEPDDVEDGAELCADCYKEIDDMVAFMVKNPTIHFDGGKQIAPKKQRTNGPNIDHGCTKRDYTKDMGKVHALLDAGWSKTKIGEEFNVSGQTIANWLKQEQEENNQEA